MFLHQLQDIMLLGYGKFKFYFLEISGLLYNIYSRQLVEPSDVDSNYMEGQLD